MTLADKPLVARALGLAADTAGATAVVFAVCAAALFGTGALAIDYGLWTHRLAAMQATADAAALAGARGSADGPTQALARASDMLRSKGIVDGQYSVTSDGVKIRVELFEPAPKAFLPILGPTEATLRAVAIAEAIARAPACLVALDPNATVGMDFSLGGAVEAIDCAIWSNATSASSIDANGSGMVASALTCAAGGITKGTLAFSPSPSTYCGPVNDPLAHWSAPVAGACTFANMRLTGSGDVTLSPGTYCGGLAVNGSVNVFLQPGTYVVHDGGLKVNGGASLFGDEVTIVMSGVDSSIDFSGSVQVSIAAPASGINQGMVLVAGRDQPVQTSKVGSGGLIDIAGSVYLPTHHLSFGGNTSSNSAPAFAVMVAKTLKFLGGATVQLRSELASTPSVVTKNRRPASYGTGSVANALVRLIK